MTAAPLDRVSIVCAYTCPVYVYYVHRRVRGDERRLWHVRGQRAERQNVYNAHRSRSDDVASSSFVRTDGRTDEAKNFRRKKNIKKKSVSG